MKTFFQGFEKQSAESSFLKDLAGGVDPTGLYTFNSAKRNSLANTTDKRHGAHRAIATAGGTLGGAAVVGPSIYGLIKGFTRATSTPGGVRKRLAAAGKGFVEGYQKPFKDIKHGISGGKALLRKDYHKANPSLEYFRKSHGESIVPTSGKLSPESVRRLPKQYQQSIGNRMQREGKEGLGVLGMSGLISGGSAYLQYGGGRQAGSELRGARDRMQAPLKPR